MKFKPALPDLEYSLSLVKDDFSQARSIGKVHLGSDYLFLLKFSGTSFLPYSRIVHAWLRQEQVNARLCCGTANFDQFYVMLDCGGGTVYRGQVLNKEVGKDCLAHIARQNPGVKIGLYKNTGQEEAP